MYLLLCWFVESDYPQYSGNVMVPFSNDFSLFFVQPTSLKSSQNSDPLTPCYAETKADLVALQNSLPGPPGYWDPLDLTESTILAGYGIDTVEKNIGWFRHAEIKHGRVAMAAVLGFIAQCTPLVSGEHSVAPYRGYVAGCTPQEQWDNIPLLGKLQIVVLIGMLESYGEGAGDPEGYVHYTKGGKPGYYPPIKGRVAGQIGLNLWDPFEFPGGPKNLSEESKARRLQAELQNGRLAMIGIMGFLAASSVPGSVPFLASIPGYPTYSGNVMVPFSNDFSLFFVEPKSLKSLQNSDPLTPCDATKADLVELQNSLPGPPGYWDPLEWGGNPALLADLGLDEEGSIG